MEKLLFLKSQTQQKVGYPGGRAALHWAEGMLTIRLSYHGAYGMGEKYNGLNQKGRTVVHEVQEKFCFQGEKTYCPAPFFWTDTGFGLYVDTCEVTSFSFLDDRIEISMPQVPVYVVTGTPEEMIRDYMRLFGPAVLPPEWAFGVWISANRWNSQQDVALQLDALKQHGFPASVLVVEAWSDEATFYIWNGASYLPVPDGGTHSYSDFDFTNSPWPDPKGMVSQLHAAGLRLVLWQIPVYKKQGVDEVQNQQNDMDWQNAVANRLCVWNTDGTPYTIPEGHWFAGSLVPDFTNPETRKSWFAKRQYLLDMGVDGFKTDGGEFILSNAAQFYDGSTGACGRNRYALDYTEAYRDFIGQKRVLFSRAGFSGQHTVPILWAGDQQSQNDELRGALSAGLSAALTGIVFWGFDLGGFAGPLPSADLYLRATQLACFCPVMQWHSEPDGGQFKELLPGYDGNNERSPWNIAQAYGQPELLKELRFWHLLRENLRPYLWSTAQACVAENKPMLRPLVYCWPDDAAARACEDAFMLGDSLLVAPFMDENAAQREVYLPRGEWVNLFDRRRHCGGQTVLAGGDGRLPVFVRNGHALPLRLGESLALGSPAEHLHLLLAGDTGSDTFWDADGNRLALQWEDGHITVAGSPNNWLTWDVI